MHACIMMMVWVCLEQFQIDEGGGSSRVRDAAGSHFGAPELRKARWSDLNVLHSFIHSFIQYTLFNPQIRCVAADILRQPSSLPCLGISSTM